MINIPQSTTFTAGVLFYSPASQQYYLSTVTNANTTIPSAYTSANPTDLATQVGLINGPLLAWASAVRPVASCLTLQYSGKEVDRSGIVSFTNRLSAETYGDFLAFGRPVRDLETRCPMAMRMPSDCLEVKWCPDRSGTIFVDGRAQEGLFAPNQTQEHYLQTNGIAVCWSGLNAASIESLRIEITTVYEWKPNGNTTGQSIVCDDERGRYRPGITLDTVLNTIRKTDWYYWGGVAQNVMGMMQNMYISTPQRRIAGPMMRLTL